MLVLFMYQHECFLKCAQDSPVIKTSSLERFRDYPTRESNVPVDNFTPLSLRLADVNDGHAKVEETERKLRLYNSRSIRGIELVDDLPVGYLALPRAGGGFQGYQLVAFPGKTVNELDEIPLGMVTQSNSVDLEFRFGNNVRAFQFSIDSLVPIGKVIVSRARHATDLQDELRQRLSLCLRQRRNLEASMELPEENAFLHAGDYIENAKGQYSNLLVISGHLNK